MSAGPEHQGRPGGSLRSIVAALLGEISALVRGEIALAKEEFRRARRRLTLGVAWLVVATIAAVGAVNVLALAGVLALVEGGAQPLASAVLIGFALILLCLVAAMAGLRHLDTDKLAPDRTGHNLRKDINLFTGVVRDE